MIALCKKFNIFYYGVHLLLPSTGNPVSKPALLTSQTITGHAVVQLVEALCYKLEGSGFDSRWCRWNFSLTWSYWPHYGPGVDSASNSNEYQEYFLRGKGGRSVELTLPPLCFDCPEIWEPQPPGTLRACVQICNGIAVPFTKNVTVAH